MNQPIINLIEAKPILWVLKRLIIQIIFQVANEYTEYYSNQSQVSVQNICCMNDHSP